MTSPLGREKFTAMEFLTGGSEAPNTTEEVECES